MDWRTYKKLADQPEVFSRWMLEQTLELIERNGAAPALASAAAHLRMRLTDPASSSRKTTRAIAVSICFRSS